METSLEIKGPTERALHVTVPQARFAEAVEARLRQLARTVRLDGFRPGKVPMQVVRQRYLKNVYGEIQEKLAEESLREALVAEQVEPVGSPQVTVEDIGEDVPFRYQASFEVYPELTEKQVRRAEIKDIEVAVTEDDVTAGLDALCQQFAQRRRVERAAQLGDLVQFHYTACETDKTPPPVDASSQPMEIVLQAAEAADGLHVHLAGRRAGEEAEVTATFPSDDGQPVSLRVRFRVAEVFEAELPNLEDPRWLEQIGGRGTTVEGLRQAVRAHLDHRCMELRRGYMVQALTDAFATSHDVGLTVPDSLRAKCLANLRHEGDRLPETLPAEHPLSLQAAETARQLTVLQALRRLSGLEPSEEDLRQALDAHAAQFKDPVAARRQAERDPQVRAAQHIGVQWHLLIGWTLERAKVNKEQWTFGQLREHMEGA